MEVGRQQPPAPEAPLESTGAGLQVSVVIPLFNHERYIEAAIHSVLSQTRPPKEIIIIDDGSVDGSFNKVLQLQKDHPEIVFWSWRNQGAHHTLNAGILRSTGDFVSILNSDDCYEPERLAACLAVVQSDASVDVVATGVSFVDDKDRKVTNRWYDDALSFYKEGGDFALGLFNANFLMTTSNLFIRRSIFDSIGYFSPMRYVHDLELCLRIILGKRHLYFLDSPLVRYRLHDRNTISEDKTREDIERAAVFAYFIFRRGRKDVTWRSSMGSYADVLSQQGILEIVEEFLALLDGNMKQVESNVEESLPSEFLGFLSRLGVDWVSRRRDEPVLPSFVAERDIVLRQQQRVRSETKRVATLVAENTWLLNQRDAWEEIARVREGQILSLTQNLDQQQKSWAHALDELRAGNTWLLEQRDTWEKKAHCLEEHAESLAQALDAMRAGNAWLLEQRDTWEKKAQILEDQLMQLKQALGELQAGNDWLSDQRGAWEQAAKISGEEVARSHEEIANGHEEITKCREEIAKCHEEIAKCHEALRNLQASKLFQLLTRVKLLELSHVPPQTNLSRLGS